MDYFAIQQYATQVSTCESSLLKGLRQETQGLPGANMISSKLQGRTLAFFSRLIEPKNILEIGTYTGYSTLCLAEGLVKNGLLHTIDQNFQTSVIAKKYAEKAGRSRSIQFYTGRALEILPSIPGPFDMIFIDADKNNYSRYYDMTISRLRKGGLLIADNLFWYGKALGQGDAGQSRQTRSLIDFAAKVRGDSRVQQVCLPVGDGLLITFKQ